MDRPDEGKAVDQELWEIRDILHRAVQMHIAEDRNGAEHLTKEAYQRLATFLNRTESNLTRPAGG